MTWHNDLERMIDGHKFRWGRYIKTYRIGNIEIVEYNAHIDFNRDKNDFESASSFHPFVCGKDLEASTDTLEKALITAIAHQAGYIAASEHIFRMLEL